MEAELMSLNKKLKAAGKVDISCDEYRVLRTDSERFAYTIRLMEEYEVTPKILLEEKNSIDSERYRKAGNDLFMSKQSRNSMDKILEHYTKSIVYACPNSRELSFAYGNRSALLFKARLYDHCILDIDRALISDCPESVKIKLMTRRLSCLMTLAEAPTKQIDEAFDDIQRMINKMSSENPNKKKHENDLKDLRKPRKIAPQRKLFDEEKYRPVAPNDNPVIPGASSALKVSYDDKFGRYITATRKILPGEVLSVQKGYATILAPEHFYTHCSNCLKQTWSAVPCDRCVHAVYCNQECKDGAWRDHHDVECRVIGALLDLEFNLLGLMTLRLAIRAVRDAGGFEALKRKLDSMIWSDPRTKGFTGTPLKLNENDYASVYTLAKNTKKRSSPDLFGRSFNSVFIVYCVATITDFLGEKLPSDLKAIRDSPWSIFLGGLITRHQQIIPSNVHAVSEMHGIEDRERGASIIPFLSFFNHSCDSSVTRIHYGTQVVVYAIHTINAGDQVFDNYGPHYAITDRCLRQQKLRKQFFFKCECRPCIEDWPSFDSIPSWTMQDMNRQSATKLTKVLKNFNKYVEFATASNIEDKLYMIKDLALMTKTLFDLVDLPCREINEVVETLKRVFALLSTRYQSLCTD